MLIALIVWRGIIGWHEDLKWFMATNDVFRLADLEEVALYRSKNNFKI